MVDEYKEQDESGEQNEGILNEDEIKELRTLSADLESNRGGLNELYARYKEMYFMEDETKPKWSNVDEKDIAVTISPTARNEVTGMVRLLDTSEMNITVKKAGKKAGQSDKIEAALKTMLRVSGEYRRTRIEADAALSSVLFGPVTLYSESVDDLITVNAKDKYRKLQLEEVQGRTPFLIRTINAEESYPDWGEFGLIAHKWKYTVKGSDLKNRWGMEADRMKDYVVHDVYDCESRLVYADGIDTPLLAKKHGLKRIPIVQRYAGGSNLFHKPEHQMQAFLYAKAKSRLDKRENAALTAISTSVNTRGLNGPLLSINPEGAPETIQVNYHGSVRTIMGDAKQVDDKFIDPVMFQWLGKLGELSGESTIYKQSLGEGSTGTFSGLAMLSSAGKLPLVDQTRAMEMAFRDVFLNILQRIKAESIPNDLLPASEIPEDVELEVKLTPNLPQDKLRNAQISQQLGDLVSDEYKHTELMQIADSNTMRTQVEQETLRKAILQGIVSDPEIMKKFVMAAMGMPAQPPAPPQGQGQPTPPEQDPNQMPPEMNPEMMAQMQAAQGQAQGQPNMEQMPKSDAMIPQQERM